MKNSEKWQKNVKNSEKWQKTVKNSEKWQKKQCKPIINYETQRWYLWIQSSSRAEGAGH